MAANSKIRRIARDLEKLPCELHESVLADLEFHQLIRLSSCAGARLTWSIENSLSPWKGCFRPGGRAELQKLLAITDKVKRFCFAVPKTKDDRPYIFEQGELSFLSFKSSQWKTGYSLIPQNTLHNQKTLARYWLKTLNEIVLDTTWPAFHEVYTHLVEPWVADVPGAQKVFEKIPYLGQEDKPSYNETYVHLGKRLNTKELFTTPDELAAFIDLYQQVRLKRAEALSAELCCLADLYDAHATQLKAPFDPRQLQPEEDFNATHVPTTMRHQARRLINIAKSTPWDKKDMFKHRFAWPALVPYDWCAQLFNEKVLKPGLWDYDTTTNDDSGTAQLAPTPALMLECRDIVAKRPSWAVGVPKDVSSGAKTDAGVSSTRRRQTSVPLPIYIRVHQADVKRTKSGKMHVRPRGDAELEWLGKFAQVTACLEQECPSAG